MNTIDYEDLIHQRDFCINASEMVMLMTYLDMTSNKKSTIIHKLSCFCFAFQTI